MSIENQHLALNEFVSSMPESTHAEVLEFIDNGYIKVYENGNISVRFKFADEFRRIAEYIEINTTKPAVAG